MAMESIVVIIGRIMSNVESGKLSLATAEKLITAVLKGGVRV
jgi:hypothetical protein